MGLGVENEFSNVHSPSVHATGHCPPGRRTARTGALRERRSTLDVTIERSAQLNP
jgi:hypothetical protein